MVVFLVCLPLILSGLYFGTTCVLIATKNRCVHRAHKLVLMPCFRTKAYDGYCWKHNIKCFSVCKGVWL